jgi:MFS family permease
MVVLGLGITWILDGLEVTIVGSINPTLASSAGLNFSAAQTGFAATAYLVGAVAGAIVFGVLTDRFGRKRLFLVTLAWYLVCTTLTAFSWDFWSFAAFRALAGMGIGGEYSAVNSAIDELIPSHWRGTADIAINGSWWIGTLIGALLSIPLLDGRFFPPSLGWRLAFGMGAVLAVMVLLLRRSLPESPRWLLTHGRGAEADAIVERIEAAVRAEIGRELPPPRHKKITFDPARYGGFFVTIGTLVRTYPRRIALVLALMITQAFLYNAVFFNQGLQLTTFFGVAPGDVGLYIVPFAIGNFLGALVLGRFFDVVGRKRMISGCYLVSGLLMVLSIALFLNHALGATSLTVLWSVMFFFASAGASAAYLTVSEIFPLEARATAIAFVFATGTLIGGAVAPPIFGALIGTKDPQLLALAWGVGAALMIAGGIVELVLGIDAERKSLEEIAAPLTVGRLAEAV